MAALPSESCRRTPPPSAPEASDTKLSERRHRSASDGNQGTVKSACCPQARRWPVALQPVHASTASMATAASRWVPGHQGGLPNQRRMARRWQEIKQTRAASFPSPSVPRCLVPWTGNALAAGEGIVVPSLNRAAACVGAGPWADHAINHQSHRRAKAIERISAALAKERLVSEWGACHHRHLPGGSPIR